MVALNKTYRKTLTPYRSAQDSGLRYYSPEISRWLSRDPIEERGGLNLYRFVGNEPVGALDPWGLQEVFSGTLGVDPLGEVGVTGWQSEEGDSFGLSFLMNPQYPYVFFSPTTDCDWIDLQMISFDVDNMEIEGNVLPALLFGPGEGICAEVQVPEPILLIAYQETSGVCPSSSALEDLVMGQTSWPYVWQKPCPSPKTCCWEEAGQFDLTIMADLNTQLSWGWFNLTCNADMTIIVGSENITYKIGTCQ